MKARHKNYADVFGQRLGLGLSPALIVIDFMQGYITPASPLYASGVVTAVAESVELLAVARQQRIPVIHTRVRYESANFADGGLWVQKIPALKCLVEGNSYASHCPEVLPIEGETIVTKHYASAFFGTSLASMLTALRIDTTLLIGCSTSGCVRASAVDAIQHGFRPIVVRECVGDRHPEVHESNLFDIDSKYGDVMNKAEVIRCLQSFATAVSPAPTFAPQCHLDQPN